MTDNTGGIDGRTALVTGAARGMGRAIAERLANDGYSVVGIDIIDQAASPVLRTIQADLSSEEGCAAITAEVDRVDVLVNNAAIFVPRAFQEITMAEFDRTVAVNLRAPFYLSQAFVGGMADRQWGRIVNISSISARHGGLSAASAYAATKAGLIALTKSIGRFYGAQGVTANSIAPGAVKTFMTEHWTQEDYERFIPQIPAGRIAEPWEIAAAVSFLASDEAAYINGVTLDVNGGWAMY